MEFKVEDWSKDAARPNATSQATVLQKMAWVLVVAAVAYGAYANLAGQASTPAVNGKLRHESAVEEVANAEKRLKDLMKGYSDEDARRLAADKEKADRFRRDREEVNRLRKELNER